MSLADAPLDSGLDQLVVEPSRADRAAARSPWRNALAVVGMVVITAWVIIAVFASFIAPFDPLAQHATPFLAPSSHHWLGTDQLGRDVLSRVLHGARLSLPLAVLLVAIDLVIGAVLGALAGFFGGWVDMVMMRLADLVFAFPGITLARAIAAALGPELHN